MKNNLQKGSAQFLVIIALVVALLGALGFVFWQNFMQSKTTDNNFVATKNDTTGNTSGSNLNSTSNEVVSTVDENSSNVGYLVLNDWGVRFRLPYGLGNDEVVYEKATDMTGSDEKYYFSTKGLSALGSECSKAYGLIRGSEPAFAPIGSPIAIAKIGDYYYSYYTPQASCLDNREKGIDVEQHVSNMLPLMFGSIEQK